MATMYSFGPFRLDGESKILFRGTEPTPAGQRAVALLRVLVEQPGAPVSKDALIEAAWPGLAIEDSNLTVQIAALRKVLGQEPGGARWIETLSRRGYRFVGPRPAEIEVGVGLASPPNGDPYVSKATSINPELRQLSVISCELMCVGLDLEHMPDAVRAFRNCVAGAVVPFRGFVAKEIGNTVVAYFGHPAAYENDVEQAVHGALAVCAAVDALDVAEAPLGCRVGVATGPAVVDGTHDGVVGQMSGLATRLQMSARDGVVIDETTRQLVGSLFECRDIAAIDTGAGAPVPAWHVLRANSIKSRFESLHGTALTPFVGRG
jgi:DNA-binding winged helix-turn-helix (wHTH) protein